MSNSRQSAEPPASRPMARIVLILVSIACFAASLTQVAFIAQAVNAKPLMTMPASAPATTSQPVSATAPAIVTATSTAPAMTSQPAATNAPVTTQTAAAQQIDRPIEPVSGLTCLLYGAAALKELKVAWLANVAYALTLLLCLSGKTRKIADGASLVCIALAVTFLLTEEITINGELKKIVSYGLGFYLWFASMLTIWFAFIMDPAWKFAADVEPGEAPAAKTKKAKVVEKAKSKKETQLARPKPTPDDWQFFYGRKPKE